MGIHVAQDMATLPYRFTDPDALLSCDAPECVTPWVTAAGLVVWAVSEGMHGACFNDRLVIACSPACLDSALHATGRCTPRPLTTPGWDIKHSRI